jgi:tRNA-2-methylthio-N6-dimethylallyladenosine synthase
MASAGSGSPPRTRSTTDSLIQAYAEVPKLANYLHLPVQHGSDRILARMKRGHTVIEYKQKIRKLREVRPDLSLSSDFIVGFPGETNEDFEALMKLIADIGFDLSFSFIYSPRPGTPAANFTDDTPMDTKKNRLQVLQARVIQQAMAISRGMIGRQTVLVRSRPERALGRLRRTENMRWVNLTVILPDRPVCRRRHHRHCRIPCVHAASIRVAA